MDVMQIACAHCGTVNEIIGRRTFGDYNPLCIQCKEPVRAKRPIISAGGRGDLQLRHLPGRGIGVFTRASVREGVLVERCPAYILQRSDRGDVIERLNQMEWLPYADSSMQAQTGYQMCLPWFKDEVRVMVLGYGMLYNHASYATSNLQSTPYVDPDTNRRYVDYTAKDDIASRTELTVTYTDTADLWFHEKSGS